MPRIEANLGLQTFQTQVVFIHPAVPDQPAYTIDTSPSGPPRTPHPKPLQNSRSKHASARPSIRYPPNHPIPIPAKLHAQRPYPHQDPETTVLCKSNTEERESRKTGQQKKKGKRPAAAHLLRNSPRTPNSPHEPRCGAPPARSDGTNPPLFSFTNAGCGYQKMKERKKGKKRPHMFICQCISPNRTRRVKAARQLIAVVRVGKTQLEQRKKKSDVGKRPGGRSPRGDNPTSP